MSCSPERVRAAQERHTDRLLSKKNVIGTGCGDGYVAVYVEKKEPYEDLDPNDWVARTLDANRHDDEEGVPVKVVETGPVKALPLTNMHAAQNEATGHFPDARRGSSSGNSPRNITGTLGCYVRDANGTLYALSNNHVYAGQQINTPVAGQNIVWPGPADNPQAVLGRLTAWSDIVFSTSANNRLDAAIAEVTNPSIVGGNHDYVGPVAPVPSVGTPVEKHGRTTHFTTGTVSETNVTVVINFGGNRNARFVGQWAVASGTFGNPGDSGSVVVRRDNKRPVGQLFAGGSTHTFMNPIHETFDYFGVTMDDNGETPVPPEPVDPCPNPDTVVEYIGSVSRGNRGTSVTYPLPNNSYTGDFLLATVSSNNQVVSAPSGWTLLGSNISGQMRDHVFYKFLDHDGSVDYTFTVPNESLLQGGITVWSNVDPDNPILASTVNQDATNAPEPRHGPSLNGLDHDGRVLHYRQTRRGIEAPIEFSTNAPNRTRAYSSTASGFGVNYSSVLFFDDCDVPETDATYPGIPISASASETHNLGRTIALRAAESPSEPPPPPPECPDRRDIELRVSIDGDDVTVEVLQDSGPYSAVEPSNH